MRLLIEAIAADITTLRVDAIVNPAHPSLIPGGGIDAAIHRAAGRGLAVECLAFPEVEHNIRCPVGEVRVTSAQLLPCKAIIHTAGPVWADQTALESDALLAACYRSALRAAAERGFRSIAFPCISTETNGFPSPRAAQLAVATVNHRSRVLGGIEHVLFACVAEFDLVSYQHQLRVSIQF